MADMDFIEEFLSTVEGKRQIRGYIPCYFTNRKGSANYYGDKDPADYRAMGASGVTIATGCDLGQTSEPELMSYGMGNYQLMDKLAAYIGKKKIYAIKALHKKPLTISMPEAEYLDRVVHKGYLDRWVRPAYEKVSAYEFDSLPKEAQAVVMSVCFQKGCGGVARDWPKLWGYLTTKDWYRASRELHTGFREYKGRRAKEGDLLDRLW